LTGIIIYGTSIFERVKLDISETCRVGFFAGYKIGLCFLYDPWPENQRLLGLLGVCR
jgi:hypothetical protein